MAFRCVLWPTFGFQFKFRKSRDSSEDWGGFEKSFKISFKSHWRPVDIFIGYEGCIHTVLAIILF